MFRKTVLAMLFLGAAAPLATAQSLYSPARNDYESGFGADHLATGDFDADGNLDVVASGGDDDTLHVFLGDGRGLFFFGDGIVLPFGSFPGAIVAGQFDTGSTLDLAVAVEDANGSGTAGTTGGIRILLGNGDGTFTAGVVESGSTNELALTGLATGDLNGDAFGDLVLLNSGNDSYQVFLGTNSGDFIPVGATIATCDRPTAVALGNLNAIPGTDMVIVCDPATGPSANGIVRRFSGVAGVFTQMGTDLTPTTLGDPRGVVIADLNNDTAGGLKNDVAIANSRLDGTFPDQGSVTVLRGDGVGGLTEFSPASFVVGFNAVSVAAGDIDGDGIMDLILANLGTEDISVMKGSIVNIGQPSARPNYAETFFAAGLGVRNAVFADVDGQGNLDVLAVASNSLTGTLSSYLGGGDDLVQRALRLPMPRNVANEPLIPNAMAAAAFNADAVTDFAVANLAEGTVSIFNSTAPNTYSITKISGFDSPFDIVAADADSDGDNDLMVLTSPLPVGGLPVSGQVFTYLNNGAGQFSSGAGSPDSVGFSPFAMVAAQLTADTRVDLAITNSDSNTVTVLSGGSGGNFTNTSTFPTTNGGDCSIPNDPDVDCTPQGIAAGDIDGDGDQDLVVVDFGDTPPAGSTLQVFKNSGTGTFTHFQELSSASDVDNLQFQVVRVGDLDGINGPDVFAVAFDPDDLVAVFLNEADASGTLAEPINSPFLLFDLDFPTRFAPRNTALADLNGDGILDFAITGEDTNNVSVGLGAGDGTFFLARVDAFGTTQVPTAVAVADTDGDGLKDLVVTGEGSDDLALLGSGMLRRSDMDGSGRVDGFDLALLGRLFSKDFNDPEYDFYLDVNLDGTIDGVDLAVLGVAFGTVF